MIRLATDADTDALLELNRVCYPDEADPLTEMRVLGVARKNPTWVVEDDGVKACLLSEISEGQPYIWSVATLPSHRGRGLAASLIKEFETYYAAQGYPRAWLHVRDDNPAQKLYFDLGYRVRSVVNNIYGPNEHGLVMRKRIG